MDLREIETRVIEAFVVPTRRGRFSDGLASPKHRSKILDRLNHCVDDLDSRYRSLIARNRQSAAEIERLLIGKGAPRECYVISSWSKLDRRTMPLVEALTQVIGYGMGTVVSCVPGQLAYYEAEDAGERYILERMNDRVHR